MIGENRPKCPENLASRTSGYLIGDICLRRPAPIIVDRAEGYDASDAVSLIGEMCLRRPFPIMESGQCRGLKVLFILIGLFPGMPDLLGLGRVRFILIEPVPGTANLLGLALGIFDNCAPAVLFGGCVVLGLVSLLFCWTPNLLLFGVAVLLLIGLVPGILVGCCTGLLAAF